MSCDQCLVDTVARLVSDSQPIAQRPRWASTRIDFLRLSQCIESEMEPHWPLAGWSFPVEGMGQELSSTGLGLDADSSGVTSRLPLVKPTEWSARDLEIQ